MPDGDTGTNMSMTIGAARAELEAMPDKAAPWPRPARPLPPPCCAAHAATPALSQAFVPRLLQALKDKTEASAADLAAALQQGVEAAYKAVMKPTEGTILTVSRLAAEKAAECTGMEVPAMWDATLQAGQAALDDTPTCCPC